MWESARVGIRWIDADVSTGIVVTNPGTGVVLGFVPKPAAQETREAIDVAETVRHVWAKRTAKDCSQILCRGE